MSILFQFVQKLINTIQAALTFLASIPGMIIAAIASVLAFVGDLFGISRLFSPVVTLLQTTTGLVESIVEWTQESYYSVSGSSGLAGCIRYVIALDSLVSDLVTVFGLTFGVLIYVFFSFVSAIVVILCSLFVVRGIQKLISVFSAGYVKT